MITLQEAIQNRHSVRQYIDRPIETEKLQHLQQLIDQCNKVGNLHIQLVTNEPNAFASGLATYGRFSGISNYLALVCKKGDDTVLGYFGERIVLEAQRLGLNTCWVGLTFKKQPDQYTILPGETMLGVISLGYGATQGKPHPQKKGIEAYCKVDGAMPDWFRKGMEAALLAPTAINQQKFEFQLTADNKVEAHIRFTMFNNYAKTDLGIVMCHFEIGAEREEKQLFVGFPYTLSE